MSSINPYNSRISYIDTVNTKKYENIIALSTLSAFPAIGNSWKTLYIAQDTDIGYLWNGSAYIIEIQSASSTLTSITAGTNIAVTGTGNTRQVATIADPAFNTVSLTTQSLPQNAVRKDYADTIQTNLTTHINDHTNPHVVTKQQVSLGNVQNILSNFTAIVAPTNLNDSSQGYSVGSKWVDTVGKKAYQCVDATIGAAVWILGTEYLYQLKDVDITTVAPVVSDGLVYDGAKWRNKATTSVMDLTNSLLFCAPLNTLISAGTQTQDTSSYAMVGTLNVLTSANLVVGKLGNAINFAAVNNQYIDFGLANQLNFQHTSNFSIGLWMNSTATDATDRCLMGRALSVNGSGWYFNYFGAQNRFTIHFSDNLTTQALEVQWSFGTGVISNTGWHFIVLTHKAEYGWTGNSFNLYVDGVLRNDVMNITTQTLLQTDDITAAATNFRLGDQFSGGTSLQNCILDQCFIVNTPLVLSEVQSLYNNGIGTELFTVNNVISHNHYPSDIIGIIPVTQGGTNLNLYNVGDLIVASGITTLASLPDIAVNNVLKSGGVGGLPSYGKVNLGTDVTGALPASSVSATTTGHTYLVGTTAQTQLDNTDTTLVTLNTNKIDTITTANQYLLNITGTGNFRSLDNKIGANTGYQYGVGNTVGNTAYQNSSLISFLDNVGNPATSFSTTQRLVLGGTPVNRAIANGDSTLVELSRYFDYLPTRVIITIANTNYLSFDVAGPITLHTPAVSYIQLDGVSNVYSSSGSYVIPADNTQYNIFITNMAYRTASNVLTLPGTNHYATHGNTQLDINTLDTQIFNNFGYIATNSSNIATNTTNIATNTTNITTLGNQRNYNILAQCDFASLFNAGFNLSTITYNSYGSATVQQAGALAYDTFISFKGNGYPKQLLEYSNPIKRTYLVLKLTGANWGTTNNVYDVAFGFANQQWFMDQETTTTGALSMVYTSTYAGCFAQFSDFASTTTTSFFGIPSGSSTHGTRVNNPLWTPVTTTQLNDYLLFYVDETGPYFYAYWYDSTFTYKAYAYINVPTGASNGVTNATGTINVMLSNVVHPIFNSQRKGAGNEITVLSQKEITAIGFPQPTNGICYYQG